jgi:general secretion pathway protein G
MAAVRADDPGAGRGRSGMRRAYAVAFVIFWLAAATVVTGGCAGPDARVAVERGEAEQVTGRANRVLCARDHVDRWGRVRQALDRFHRDVGRYPTSEEGLEALVAAPTGLSPDEQKSWKGPYVASPHLIDPWGSGLRYRHPPLCNEADPDAAPPQVERRGTGILLKIPGRYTISPDRQSLAVYPDAVDLWSMDPDGKDDTGDEVGNWDSFTRPDFCTGRDSSIIPQPVVAGSLVRLALWEELATGECGMWNLPYSAPEHEHEGLDQRPR